MCFNEAAKDFNLDVVTVRLLLLKLDQGTTHLLQETHLKHTHTHTHAATVREHIIYICILQRTNIHRTTMAAIYILSVLANQTTSDRARHLDCGSKANVIRVRRKSLLLQLLKHVHAGLQVTQYGNQRHLCKCVKIRSGVSIFRRFQLGLFNSPSR